MYLLTPMEIHNHQFKKSFRGYSENEVDDFLDRIVEDFEKLLRENDRLQNQINSDKRELEQYRKLEKTLNDTLMVAQRTADEVITAAKKNADEMKENVARECQTIREQARFDAAQQVEKATTKRDAILVEYDKFVREKKAFLMKLRTILETELTITAQMIENVPDVSEEVKKILPKEDLPAEEPIKAAEHVKPVKPVTPVKTVTPAKTVKPVTKPAKPEEPKPFIPAKDEGLTNLVDVATKHVTEEKDLVTDGTMTYTPVKPSAAPKLSKES